MNSYSTSWWSLLLINRPPEDERLSWPCWLTYSGRLTHKVIIRPASSQVQDRESSPVRDQRSTTVLRRQRKVVLTSVPSTLSTLWRKAHSALFTRLKKHKFIVTVITIIIICVISIIIVIPWDNISYMAWVRWRWFQTWWRHSPVQSVNWRPSANYFLSSKWRGRLWVDHVTASALTTWHIGWYSSYSSLAPNPAQQELLIFDHTTNDNKHSSLLKT